MFKIKSNLCIIIVFFMIHEGNENINFLFISQMKFY